MEDTITKPSGNVASPLEEEGRRGSGEPEWYVIHTFSGHELKVKDSIEKMVKNRGIEDKILEVSVPMEEVIEMKDGQRKVKKRKKIPGYVFLKMIITNETWYLVRNTRGVTGFVGNGTDPFPLTPEEMARLGFSNIDIELDIKVNDLVHVINGPFVGKMGKVSQIRPEKQELTAMISMFGRDIPVKLNFSEVDKVE